MLFQRIANIKSTPTQLIPPRNAATGTVTIKEMMIVLTSSFWTGERSAHPTVILTKMRT
ncbi:MAG: hypothetical protein ACXAC8_18615 [Candidatus Hodarchaeales archaeon]